MRPRKDDLDSGSSSTPTQPPSRPTRKAYYTTKPIFQQAKMNMANDVRGAGIHPGSTAEVLISKLTPILAKYDNSISVSKYAYDYLRTIGVAPENIEVFRYNRNQLLRQLQDKKYTERGYRTQKGYTPRVGTVRRMKEGPVSKTTEANRRVRQLQYKSLLERLEQAGYAKETDPKVFLQIEDDVRGPLSKLKYGQLLGEHMLKTRNDPDWYQSFIRARDYFKGRRHYHRLRAGLGKPQEGNRSASEEDSTTSESWRSTSSPKSKTTIVASKKAALRPRRTTKKFVVSSDEDDISDERVPWRGKINIKKADLPKLTTTRRQLSMLKQGLPTRPRSKTRIPRKSYDAFASEMRPPLSSHEDNDVVIAAAADDADVGSQHAKVPSLVYEDDPSTLWREPILSPEESAVRPTIGAKRFRGSAAIPEFESESGSISSRPVKRPTVAKKRFTGAAPSVPQTASLAPKRETTHFSRSL